MWSEFAQQLVVVTGAAQGIGQAVAEALLAAGAKVAALDIQFQAQPTSAQCEMEALTQWPLDVTDSAQVDQTIAQIEQALGPIRYLVCAAGILTPASLLHTRDDTWSRMFDVNVSGTFFVCRAVAQVMRSRQQGSIVAIGSNAAHAPRMQMGCYAATKAALHQLIKCLALELAADSIRCNVIAPGSTDTPMQRQLWHDDNGAQRTIAGSLDSYRTGIPLGRIASPAQIADSVLFLLSERACHITMETWVVDGGATLGMR